MFRQARHVFMESTLADPPKILRGSPSEVQTGAETVLRERYAQTPSGPTHIHFK